MPGRQGQRRLWTALGLFATWGILTYGCALRRPTADASELSLEREVLLGAIDPDLFAQRVKHLEHVLQTRGPMLKPEQRRLLSYYLEAYKEYLALYSAHVLDNRAELRRGLEKMYFTEIRRLKELDLGDIAPGLEVPKPGAKPAGKPLDVEVLRRHFKEGSYEEVITLFEAAPDQGEQLTREYAKELYALALSYAGAVDKALPLLRELVVEKKGGGYLGELRVRLGACHEQEGQKDLAVRVYRKLLLDFAAEQPYLQTAVSRIHELTGEAASLSAGTPTSGAGLEVLDLLVEKGQLGAAFLLAERAIEAGDGSLSGDEKTRLASLRDNLEQRLRRELESLLTLLEKAAPGDPGARVRLEDLEGRYGELPILLGYGKRVEALRTSFDVPPPSSSKPRDAVPEAEEVEQGYLEILDAFKSAQNSPEEKPLLEVRGRLLALLPADRGEKMLRLLVKVEDELSTRMRGKAADCVKAAKRQKGIADQVDHYLKAYKILDDVVREFEHNPGRDKVAQNRDWVGKKLEELEPGRLERLQHE